MYISGQIPIDPSTSKLVDGGIEEQTELVIRNIGNILRAAGYDYSHVIKSTIFITEIEDFAKVNEVYAKFYRDDAPARSTVQVCRLPWDALIEIETIAAKPTVPSQEM